MKYKLDENIGMRGVQLLANAGHDVATVYDQSLGGTPDDNLFEVCVAEKRTLITLYHDFGQVIRFPPETSHGIVILEIPPRANPDTIIVRLKEFLSVLAIQSLGRELWIVEPGRVRIHQTRETD